MRMAVMLEMVDSVLGRAEVRVGPEPAAMLNPSDWDRGCKNRRSAEALPTPDNSEASKI